MSDATIKIQANDTYRVIRGETFDDPIRAIE